LLQYWPLSFNGATPLPAWRVLQQAEQQQSRRVGYFSRQMPTATRCDVTFSQGALGVGHRESVAARRLLPAPVVASYPDCRDVLAWRLRCCFAAALSLRARSAHILSFASIISRRWVPSASSRSVAKRPICPSARSSFASRIRGSSSTQFVAG
jgi:hypothetical protein